MGGVWTAGLTNQQLRATAIPVGDDFASGEILADQSGAGAVLTFTFTAPVQLVSIGQKGGGLAVSRADLFGGTPTASLGIPLVDGDTIFVSIIATVIRIFAVTGSTISVWGLRR